MDELLCEDRTPRAFRAKFPEEVLQESLAGQLWFGAECLAAGSSIMNREEESATMRPLAKAVTKSLDTVRNLLREQCLRNNIPNSSTLRLDINDASTETLYESLKIFDRLFADFELSYVSAMVTVKTKEEHEMQELICVLFSETLQRALKLGLLEQDQVDSYDPSLMFSIPRLAIVAGLVIYDKGPLNMDMASDQMSEMFRPFRTLLIRIRDLIRTLSKNELHQLEQLLCTNEEITLKTNKLNCDDEKINTSDDDLVSTIVNDCRSTNKDVIPSFYPPPSNSVVETANLVCDGPDSNLNNGNNINNNNNEWDSDNKDTRDLLVQPDCATGYLIPNTNFGNLLLPNEAPLTDSFISSDCDEDLNTATTETRHRQQNEPQNIKLGKCTSNGDYDNDHSKDTINSDRLPEETNITIDQNRTSNHNPVLQRRYQGNWENLEKTQPGCSKRNSDSSDESERNAVTTSSSRTSSKKLDRNSSSNKTIKIRSKSSKNRDYNNISSNSSHHHSTSSNSRRKSKSADSNSSSGSSTSSSSTSSSSCDTSSCQSEGDPQEVALAMRAAGRMKNK